MSLGVLLLVSCSKTPKCNDEEVKKEVISLFKKTISDEIQAEYKSAFEGEEYYTRVLPLLKNTNKYIDDLEIKLTETISTEIKDDIKKCVCEADFNTIDKQPITEHDIKEFLKGEDILNHEYQIENFTPTIKYSAQFTDDKRMKIIIDNMQDLEIIRNNIAVKLLRDIYREAQKLSRNKPIRQSSSSQNIANSSPQYSQSHYVGDYFYVNGSEYQKVYFYNAPDESTRRNAYFSTYERVFVEKTQDGFGYVNFTNDRGQVSKGWIKMQYLEKHAEVH